MGDDKPMASMLRQFPLVHPKRRQIELAFGVGPFRRIASQPQGAYGQCYWTVKSAVETGGGVAVYGWRITFVPRALVMGDHHAIWQNPEGALLDITPQAGEKAQASTFAVDPADFEHPEVGPPFVAMKHFPLSAHPTVKAYVAANDARITFQRETHAELIAAGASWQEGKLIALTPGAQKIGERYEALNRAEAEAAKALTAAFGYWCPWAA